MSQSVNYIAELGVIGFVTEAVGILRANAKALIPVQLVLGLPSVLLSVAVQFLQAYYRPATVRASSGPAGVDVSLMDSLKVTFATNRISLSHSLVMIIMESLALQAFEALAVSANIYAVGLFYTEGTISFMDVVKSAIQRFWVRLVVTMFYLQVIVVSTLLFSLGFIFLIVHFELDPSWISLPSIILLSVIIHITVISTVASGVTVLEEDYGWTAISKSRRLLKGKLMVSLRFQLLLFVIVTVSAWPSGRNLARFRRNPMNPMPYVWAIPCVLWNTIFSQITALAMGVAFVSFKARHGESIIGSLVADDELKEDKKYEMVENVMVETVEKVDKVEKVKEGKVDLEEILIEEIEYPSIEKESKDKDLPLIRAL